MLYIKDYSMQVSGITVPGLVKKVEITGAAVIDSVTDDNNITLGYQPNGYEPLKVNVDVLLEPSAGESLESMAAAIQFSFKPPGQTAAVPLELVNSLAAAVGLTKVYFKGITFTNKTESSSGEAALEFWEYLPVVIQTQAVASTGISGAGTSTAASQSSADGINAEYQEYLNTQRGQAPKIKDKTSESPAQDS